MIWLVVALIALMLPTTLSAAQHTIDAVGDLPYTTTTTYDTVNVVTNNIIFTGSGNAITLSHDHCVLNLNGNRLYVMNNIGIGIQGDTCTVLNGTIEQHPTSTATGIDMVNVGTAKRHTTITNLSVHARNHDCGGLFSYNAIELEINGGNWTSYVTSFTRRDYAETAPIRTDESDVSVYDAPQQFRAWVHNVTIDSCPHMGISLRGGKMLVDSNFVSCDGRNGSYTYPSGDMMWGWANNYGILLGRVGPGSRIIGNTVRSGTNHGGGRGISVGGDVNNTYGVVMGGCLEIAGNDVDIHAGPDPNYGTLYVAHGFHIKGLGHDSIYIHHNTISVTADTALATAHTGPKAGALWLMEGGVFWRIEYNTLRAMGTPGLYGYRSYSSSCGIFPDCGTSAKAVVLDALGAELGETGVADPTRVHDSIVFRYNRIEANVIPISFGERSTGGVLTAGEQVRFHGDTVNRITPDFADEFGNDGAIAMGLSNGDCENNYMTDVVFVADSVVDWDGDGPGEMTFRRTFKTTVLGNDGIPFEGARVRIRNARGLSTVVGTTDENGSVSDYAAAIKYLHIGVGSDTTYSPFTISAIYGTDSVAITETGIGFRTNLNDTLTLTNTGGNGTVDTIAPGTVGDLSVLPASIPGHFVFGWTSTGNDGTVGSADYDSIRYSVSPLTTSNWSAATIVARTTPPEAYGVHDEVDIAESVPVPGRFYYVGIKAYDNSGHSSPMSVDSGFARGILTPQIALDMVIVDTAAQEITVCGTTVRSYLSLQYELQIAAESGFDLPQSILVTDFDTHACGVLPLPADNSTVYVRCRAAALDLSETSPWSTTRAFSISGGEVNQPPGIPVAISPLSGDTMTSLTPNLMVANSADVEGDPITYQFELYNAAGTSRLAASDMVAEGPTNTGWLVPAGLIQDRVGYRFTARSHDGQAYSSWMSPVTFLVVMLGTGGDPLASVTRAYPNPVHFATGEQVIFVLPEDPVDLTIMTVSGEIVLRREKLSGQWAWDGANQSGARVAVGLYLWFVSDESGKGKLVVQP